MGIVRVHFRQPINVPRGGTSEIDVHPPGGTLFLTLTPPVVQSGWGRSVSLAFGKVLAADPSEVLVRSVANPRVLLT